MADRLVAQAGIVDTAGLEVLERMVDQGDGTWARKVVSTGGGGGTQYAEGATQATPTATAILWKDASNVLHVPSVANPLPVTIGAVPGVLADGMAPIAVGQIGALAELYNGATNDRAYNNLQLVLAASAARTAAPAIPIQANPNHRGCLVFLNITASPANAAAALTLAILALDPVSGATMPLFTPTAIFATGVANAVTGLYVAQLYPGLPVQAATTKNGAPASANGLLPRVWSVSITPATADSWSYSCAAALVL